jgi:hypothetical protein
MDATGSLSAIRDENANFIGAYCQEPTIGELMADPLTHALMKADHVDAQDFERMLHSVAGRLQAGRARLPMIAFDAAAPNALWRASIELFPASASAPVMQGASATKSTAVVCGSPCPW